MHPCASRNPPSWCGKKRSARKGKRKVNRKALGSMLAVANNPPAHGFRVVSKGACIKGNGRLKKGCMWGRGRFKGKIFKRA